MKEEVVSGQQSVVSKEKKLPCIPMTVHHQRLILEGRKSTTLRAKRFEPGLYRMFSRGGGSLGYLEVVHIADSQQVPANSSPEHLAWLAKWEGYDSAAAFMETLRKLRLDPTKPYWLHYIMAAEAASTEAV